MATKKTNPLELNNNTLKELFNNKSEMPTPSFSVGGAGIPSTGGSGTVSQAYNNYLANIDWKKRTPLQNALEFGSTFTTTGENIGREEQKKAIERIKQEATDERKPIPSQEFPASTSVKKQEAKKLYRVMFAGEGPDSSIIAKTKEEADKILLDSGKKGAIAGINMQQKTRGGEMLTDEQSEKRSKEYVNQLLSPQEKEKKRMALLETYRSPEYKAALQERVKAANEAKLAEDKIAGEAAADWFSKVKARRDAGVSAYDEYNYQKGLLNKGERAARMSGDYGEAFNIAQKRKKFEKGIPEEMGARMKFFQKEAYNERADQIKQLRDQEENRKLYASNPNAISYAAPKKPISLWNVNNSLSLE
jgi:hypothetical protein